MLQDELQQIWQGAAQQELVRFERSKLLMEMDRQLADFKTRIRRRDWLEIIVAIVMIPIFTATAILMPYLSAQIGSGILVAWMLYVIIRLRRNQNQEPPSEGLSMREYLQQSRAYVLKQIQLLNTVLYWYLLPPAIGLGLFFWADGSNVGKTIVLFAGVLALYGYIWYMNKQAVKNELEPVLKQIDEALEALEALEVER